MPGRSLSTIPSSDEAFKRAVEQVADADDSLSAAALRDRLRPLYPQVEVFERQLNGEQGHLYVYRNGRYEPAASDRWWELPGTACVCVSRESGRLTSVSNEWAAMMHASSSDLVGRHYTEFVQPDARPAAEAMLQALTRGEVDTEAVIRRPDGTTIAIEIHATPIGDEIDVRYRLRDR